VPAHWVPILAPGFSGVQVLSVNVGPGFELPDCALALPRLERIKLMPGREPGDGVVVDTALRWADRRGGARLEWLEQVLDGDGIRKALRPALPGERAALPEERLLRTELVPESKSSRVFRTTEGSRAVMRAEDVPPLDLFGAPAHRALVASADLLRIRRALFVELVDPGAPFPTTRLPVAVALAAAKQLVDALEAWWGRAAPDVLSGEWVGLGRDQLRFRADGSLALVPALTRRLGPDAWALPDLAGVPLAWSGTAPMIVRFVAAVLFEWLSGVSFLESQLGTATAVHERLRLRLRHPPTLSSVDPELARYDLVLLRALSQPASWSPAAFVGALEAA
jgi:hypothetical protein